MESEKSFIVANAKIVFIWGELAEYEVIAPITQKEKIEAIKANKEEELKNKNQSASKTQPPKEILKTLESNTSEASKSNGNIISSTLILEKNFTENINFPMERSHDQYISQNLNTNINPNQSNILQQEETHSIANKDKVPEFLLVSKS